MPESKHSFAEGELVAANYQVLSIAGSGGMGVVYRALDLRLQRNQDGLRLSFAAQSLSKPHAQWAREAVGPVPSGRFPLG